MIAFTNATLIDGTACAAKKADVVVDGDKIVQVLPAQKAQVKDKIDVRGKILCPGFMDIHAHSELEVLRDPSMAHKISQGITFDLSGNCGVGAYPRKEDAPPCYTDILGHCKNWNWTDFASYAKTIKTGMNIAFLQPHANLRVSAIDGNPNRSATKQEVAKMCALLDKSLDQGCMGFSSGIYYAPNIFAEPFEYTELLKVVKNHNAMFAVHHRCEGTEIIKSVEEIIRYAKEANVQLEVSHLKVVGKDNQSKIDTVLKMIHQAREEGLNIAFDQYPYNFGSTSLFSLLPPKYLRLTQSELLATLSKALTDKKVFDDLVYQMQNPDTWDSLTQLCGFDQITAVILESSPQFNGMTITECAKKLKTDEYSALFTLLSKETKCALMADVTQSSETMKKVIKDDLMCFGTDALYAGESAHPRSGNAAIHLLTEYCIKEKTLSFEQAINRMTKRVADRLKITDRGVIKEGNYADLVVFDPNTLCDNSNLQNPFAKCTGLEYVMVNGQFAIDKAQLTKSLSGKVIYS